MKKLISTFLTVAFVLSLGVVFAPATAADDVLPELRPDAEVALVDGYLLGVAPGSSAADVAALFTENVHVIDHIGQDRTGSDLAATGWRVAAASASATVIICGDTNCDGKINVRDVLGIMREIVSGESLRFTASADVSPDGAVNAKDVAVLMRYLVGYDVTLGELFFKVREKALVAPDEDASLDLFFEDSLAKNGPRSDARTEERTFVMHLARNEKESCQAILFSGTGHEGLRAELTPFVNGKGEELATTLLFEDYITLNRSKAVIPDRLPPVEAIGAFDVRSGERQGLYVEVGAGEDAAAGLYRARLDLTDAGGKTVKSAYVYADVWDFAIPVETSVRTAVGMGLMDGYNRRTRDSTKDAVEHYVEYYEYFLDNRINPWDMPYAPTDERADEWMDDPRVNTFLVGGGYAGDVYSPNATDADIAAAYEKLSQNPGWMKKALFYYSDEPGVYWDPDEIADMIGVKSRLDRLFPGATIIVPTHVNFWQDQGNANYGHRDVLDLVAEYATAPCPKIDLFISNADWKKGWQPNYEHGYWEVDETTEIVDTYGTILDRVADWKSRGHEFWWYNVTDGADHPMVNVSLGIPNMQNRMLWWVGEKYGVDGWLLWATQEWTSKKRSALDDKNGVLVYPGDDFGVDGPIACQRTAVIRDGLEDVEYLKLAKKLLGEEKASEYINALVTDVLHYETDSAAFSALRLKLGDELEAALAD